MRNITVNEKMVTKCTKKRHIIIGIFNVVLTTIEENGIETDYKWKVHTGIETLKYDNWLPVILDEELLKFVKENNWTKLYENHRTENLKIKKKFETLNQSHNDIFEKMVSGEYDNQIVFFRWEDHSFYVLSEQKLYGVKYFDYIRGITDKHYNLEGCRNHLESVNDPHLHLTDVALRIPYYNQDCGHLAIEFKYLTELPMSDYDSFEIYESIKTKLGLDKYKLPEDED